MKKTIAKASDSVSTTKPKRSATAVRGKYFNRLQRGTNLVILDPALMPYFPDSASVNDALHAFLAIGNTIQALKPARKSSKTMRASFDPRVGIAAKLNPSR